MVYQDVYNQKIKEQAELIDFTAWRNGMYIVAAVQAALMPKKVKYPEAPLSQKVKQEQLSAEEEFILWAAEFNAQHPDLPDAGDLKDP